MTDPAAARTITVSRPTRDWLEALTVFLRELTGIFTEIRAGAMLNGAAELERVVQLWDEAQA